MIGLICIYIWGFEKTLERLDGMFALALFDREKNVLHCARDRIGIKPFYFSLHNSKGLLVKRWKEKIKGAGLQKFPIEPILPRGLYWLNIRGTSHQTVLKLLVY